MTRSVNTAAPAGISSATPLIALNAVCVDTETTGLDTSIARVIQIGAVRIKTGQLDEQDVFEQLVDPGEAIPPAASAIHGIYDRDVANAQKFGEVAASFSSWMGGAIVVGYSIGFDLAMMKREHLLADMAWTPPRSLDVRYLAELAAPQLPDYSLDTVAGWLGIEIKGRHSALGDALATAEVFTALAHKLRGRGIRTIAEAERAARRFSERATAEAQAGWHETAGLPGASRSIAGLARIDSFPYRHRARDVMHSPPLYCETSQPVADVLHQLMARKSTSMFVGSPTDHISSQGIVTERDILRAIDANGAQTLSAAVGSIANYPLQTIAETAYLYRAMGIMNRRGFRHLGVHNTQGKVVGVLSARHLLKQRGDDAISLGDQIDAASNAHDLALVWANLALVAQGLFSEEVAALDIASIVSAEMRALTRRAVEIAKYDMARAGAGAPPCAYSVLVLGSGGRGESLLAMDQDNAIVYEEGEYGSETDKWFAILGQRISDILHHAGVPYCKGGVMASNREWRMSRADWIENVRRWITRHSAEDILNTDIFFDAMSVSGDAGLAEQVLDEAFEAGRSSREFLQLMAVNAAEVPDAMGWFGRFRLEDGRIDLKRSGIMPIFSAARVLAIKHGVRARSTPERLNAVRGKTEMPDQVIDNLCEAHRLLLSGILQQQLKDLDAGIALSNRVSVKELTSGQRDRLRWALSQVSAVTNLLGDPLGLT